jgi:hypothetical protein
MSTKPMPAPSMIRAMMKGAIDYAGLFPPAGLDMASAVRNFDAYRTGPNAWMLGRFIVPAARLDEFAAVLPFEADTARMISVIATAADATALAEFNAKHGVRARIDSVETPVVTIKEIGTLGALSREYLVYAEVNITSDPTPVITALAKAGVRAKVRTGGVTAKAIPPTEQVARFMVACRKAGVVFKATAGLHHALRASYPLTYEPNAPTGEMFGFLNVILASAVAAAGGTAAEVGDVLRAGEGIMVDSEGATLPGGRKIPREAMAQVRKSVIASFGSCSFDEPVQELQQRDLL